MEVILVPMVIGALSTVTIGLKMGLGELEIKAWEEIIQTAEILSQLEY